MFAFDILFIHSLYIFHFYCLGVFEIAGIESGITGKHLVLSQYECLDKDTGEITVK